MLKQIFTVRDAKAEAYLVPFFARSRGEAIRMLTDAVNDPQHQFGIHAEDYMLFHLGAFDEETGEIHLFPQQEPIITCLELKRDVPITPEHIAQVNKVKEDNPPNDNVVDIEEILDAKAKSD